jgi:hypothetical protein
MSEPLGPEPVERGTGPCGTSPMVSSRSESRESGEKRQGAQSPKGDEERLRPRPGRRQIVLRIHEASAGNPFYALEIARMISYPNVEPGFKPKPPLARQGTFGMPELLRFAVS